MARRAEPFACLTAYDATTARWLQRAGVHLLLVGDTAAEVILGLPRTIHMPLDVSIALTAAVKRGAPDTVVMADMPFMSYQALDAEAMHNAARYMTEGLADIIKLEVDASFAPLVRKLTRAGIPVCAHVGSLPQHAAMHGGYASAGRTAPEAERIVADAVACEAAGAAMLLVEAVPPQVTERIIRETTVPVIGIGAGPACHAQILVIQDLLGMSDQAPRFAEPVAALGDQIRAAGAEWVRRVAARDIGGRPYAMSEHELDRFEQSKPTSTDESHDTPHSKR
jgi:3-methyl-2-oxobutanoate hydroxymethyltransferase